MARMPGVVWAPVSDGNSKLAMKRWDIVCVHTIVGHDPAPAAHFSTGSDGRITQSRDTAVQSAANYLGNYRVIAIENEDFGPEYGSWSSPNVPRFTAPQAEAIAKILAWCHQAHGIPLTLCPDSKTSSRGIAYHRQGIDGNWAGFAYGGRVDGGELWSTSRGKICPGDNRIRQLINEIIPRARVLAGIEKESDVSIQEFVDFRVTSQVDNGTRNLWDFLVQNEVNLAALKAEVDALKQVQQVGGIDYAALAQSVADELDKRARDNDPTTGPTT